MKPKFSDHSPPLSELAQRAADEKKPECKTCMADRDYRHANGKYYCANCPMFWEWINKNEKLETS